MSTPSNQLSSLDILKSTEEKIRNLFGLSSLDTFACMNEDELVAKFVEQHQDKIESLTKKKRKKKCSGTKVPDYDASDKAIIAESKENKVKDPVHHELCFIRITQDEAYASVRGESKGLHVFINDSDDGKISNFKIRLVHDFFINFVNIIDESGNLINYYFNHSLYFNALNLGADPICVDFLIHQSESLLLRDEQIHQLAEQRVYAKLKTLYEIWHEKGTERVSAESKDGTQKKKSIRKERLCEYIYDFDYTETISIMLDLLPLVQNYKTKKTQEDYDAQRKAICKYFETYKDQKKVHIVPSSFGGQDVRSREFQKLEEPLQRIRLFPYAEDDLNAYLNNWSARIRDILFEGVKSYASQLEWWLKKYENDPPEYLKKEHPAEFSDSCDNSEKRKELILDWMGTHFFYDALLQDIFGTASHTVISKYSIAKLNTKGSIVKQSITNK